MFKNRTRKPKSDHQLDFNVESLEDRKMLATVAIAGGGNTLKINGDNSSEEVEVERNAAGFITVNGTSTGATEFRKVKINMRGGDDFVLISDGIRVTRKTTIKLGAAGATGNTLGLGGQHSRIKIVGGQQGDDVFLTEQAASAPRTVNLKGGVNSLQLISTPSTPTPIDPNVVFSQATYDAIVANVNQVVAGTATTLLANAMDTLHTEAYFDQVGGTRPTSNEITQALNDIAAARNLSVNQVQAQYDLFLQLKQEQVQTGTANQQDAVPALGFIHRENIIGPDFMGSKGQLRYGKIVGDVLGLDPVFGSLLNPSGGLVGPGNASLNLGDQPISIHGSVHDAAGYLFNYHNTGPGYNYLGTPDGIDDTADPLAGQINGVAFWYDAFGDTAGASAAIDQILSLFGPELINADSATANDAILGFFPNHLLSDGNITESNFLVTPAAGGENNSWVTNAPNGDNGDYFANGTAPIVLEFELGGVFGFDQTIDKVAIWGYSSAAGNDVKEFTLEFSVDGGAFGNAISLSKPIFNATDNFVTVIPLGQEVEADRVRMTITDNHFETGSGGDRVGFDEIRFIGPFSII